MVIEKMTVEDVPVVYRLGREERAFKVRGGECFWTIEQLKDWVVDDEDILLVAKEGDKIIAFILSTFHRPTRKATLENQYVLPGWRGRGVGDVLARELLERLKKKGAIYVCALVRIDNELALAYYGKRFRRGHNFIWFDISL